MKFFFLAVCALRHMKCRLHQFGRTFQENVSEIRLRSTNRTILKLYLGEISAK